MTDIDPHLLRLTPREVTQLETALQGSEPADGDCNATDGFSFCTNAPGHGTVHWDRRTQHEWSDGEQT